MKSTTRGRTRSRVLVGAALAAPALALLLTLGGSNPATAQAAATVITPGDPVTASTSDDATTADVPVTNLGATPIQVSARTPPEVGCIVEPSPSVVEPGKQTTITLKFLEGCETKEALDVEMSFGGDATPATANLTVKPAKPATTPEWWILEASAAIAAAAALAVILAAWARATDLNAGAGDQGPPSGLSWSTPLDGLGTDFSFKDSWISVATLGSSALVLLFGATDVLTASLGDEPKSAVALIAVAGGLSAVLSTLGPLVLKAVGDSRDVPTAGGTLAAGLLVLTGSFLLITALTWQAADLAEGGWRVAIGVGGALVGLLVFGYGIKSLPRLIIDGSTTTAPETPVELRAADVIASAIRGDVPPTTEGSLNLFGGGGFSISELQLDDRPRRRATALL
jgi:hypothetical protein